MSQWYYSHDGEQKGPVPVSELERLVSTGEFDPEKDLVWREGMPDWKQASTVSDLGLNLALKPGDPPDGSFAPQSGDFNPYAAPQVDADMKNPNDVINRVEISPGSQPIEISQIYSRAFDLLKRNLGMILAIAVIYIGISLALSIVLGIFDEVTGHVPATVQDIGIGTGDPDLDESLSQLLDQGSFTSRVISGIVDLFLSLGILRIALNIIDGRAFTIGSLFSEGRKILKVFLAGLLYGVITFIGLLLFVVPGVYLAIRFGYYKQAIVDRDLGVIEALSYSGAITANNKWRIFLLGILHFLTLLAGLLAFIVGLLFALPLMILVWTLSYRWMQYGSIVVNDEVPA